MTVRRCQVEGHALLTGTNLFYVRVGHGDDFDRYRLRFCRMHARVVYEDLSEFEVSPEDGTLSGGDDAMTNCLADGKPVDESGLYVFVTSYPTKNERKDHWSRLHMDCRLPQLLVKGEYAE
ncbi:MAG TPA: hypothetical protein VF077_12725 [Nitrospiraceae bacterium]